LINYAAALPQLLRIFDLMGCGDARTANRPAPGDASLGHQGKSCPGRLSPLASFPVIGS
jgi:hypothetical protein